MEKNNDGDVTKGPHNTETLRRALLTVILDSALNVPPAQQLTAISLTAAAVLMALCNVHPETGPLDGDFAKARETLTLGSEVFAKAVRETCADFLDHAEKKPKGAELLTQALAALRGA